MLSAQAYMSSASGAQKPLSSITLACLLPSVGHVKAIASGSPIISLPVVSLTWLRASLVSEWGKRRWSDLGDFKLPHTCHVFIAC